MVLARLPNDATTPRENKKETACGSYRLRRGFNVNVIDLRMCIIYVYTPRVCTLVLFIICSKTADEGCIYGSKTGDKGMQQ